jgi:hypothetical protein
MKGLPVLNSRISSRRIRQGLATAAVAAVTVTTAASCTPPAPRNDPAAARQIAWTQLVARGWAGQSQCLVDLWNRESSWNVGATNPSSGAYGIPQALPAIKMASAGPDWRTNPATQIRWGLDYIAARYGNPCNAWLHETQVNWYVRTAPLGG